MKKYIVALISILLLVIITSIIINLFKTESIIKNENSIQIITTLFPQYDFVKQIGKDKVDVKLLIDAGVETHNYDPTPKDMMLIDNSDMFIYTGSKLEPWADEIINGITSDCKIVDVSKNISLINMEEFETKYENNQIVEDSEHEESESQDTHIWLNPLNAIIMIDNITESLCNIDEENTDYYKNNAEEYKNKILDIDKEIEELVESSETKELAFGGEFAYSYFIERYHLNFVSVYTNCGHGEDPNISRVKSVIDYINKSKIPIVFYEELSEGTVAKMIAEETDTEALIFYSIHNANTVGEYSDTYVSLMKKNLENLRKAL